MHAKNIFIILILIIFASCSIKNNKDDKAIVKVGKYYLYPSDVSAKIPNHISEEDSIVFAKNIIENWISEKLIFEKASKNLSEKEIKSIEKQVDDFNTYLYINKYEQSLISQKLDTTITAEDIEKCYSKHAGEFKLSFNIVKVNFIKLPIATYDAHKARKWYKSNKEEDIADLEDYCYQNAHEFEFSDEWINFNNILQHIPIKVNDEKNYLQKHKHIEVTDTLYRYFLRIKDYKLVNDTAPVSIIINKLKKVILNKRKMQFLNELKNNVYQDAIENKMIEKYYN